MDALAHINLVPSALLCCHACGQVFRDLKPENVLIDTQVRRVNKGRDLSGGRSTASEPSSCHSGALVNSFSEHAARSACPVLATPRTLAR